MLVRNKWNKREYTLIAVKDNTVVLQREDGSQFTIAEKEYLTNYIKHYDNNICEK